jgi:hypothetical protein
MKRQIQGTLKQDLEWLKSSANQLVTHLWVDFLSTVSFLPLLMLFSSFALYPYRIPLSATVLQKPFAWKVWIVPVIKSLIANPLNCTGKKFVWKIHDALCTSRYQLPLAVLWLFDDAIANKSNPRSNEIETGVQPNERFLQRNLKTGGFVLSEVGTLEFPWTPCSKAMESMINVNWFVGGYLGLHFPKPWQTRHRYSNRHGFIVLRIFNYWTQWYHFIAQFTCFLTELSVIPGVRLCLP